MSTVAGERTSILSRRTAILSGCAYSVFLSIFIADSNSQIEDVTPL